MIACGIPRWLSRGAGALGVLLAALLACGAPLATPAAKPPAAATSVSDTSAPRAGALAASASPAAAAATPLPLRKINVGMVNIGMSYLHHRIALVEGYYREGGFDAELQVLQSATLLAGL